MIIRSRAPLRLGLAGGGTDVSPFCDLYGGYVLNATIDLYTYCSIIPWDKNYIEFIAADLGESEEVNYDEICENGGTFILHRTVWWRLVEIFNLDSSLTFSMTTYSDAPPGCGLGSSSTMVVVMIKAFVEWLNLPLGEYDIAHLAFEIERIDAGLEGGRQDQYAATFGGINFIEFYDNDRVIVNPLRVKNWIISELESSMLLYYTGVSRSSAKIIHEQSSNIEQRAEESLKATKELKQGAVQIKEYLLKGDIRGIAYYISQSWEAKKRTANLVSTPIIDQAYNTALEAGAYSGKVSGAGGGGYMMFLLEPTRKPEVAASLGKLGGLVSNVRFTKIGTQGWKIQ